MLEKSLGEQLRRYDKAASSSTTPSRRCIGGARQRPDAALLVRGMLDGGVDPRYAARRIVRMASEDIGLADPRALRPRSMPPETYERPGRRKAS